MPMVDPGGVAADLLLPSGLAAGAGGQHERAHGGDGNQQGGVAANLLLPSVLGVGAGAGGQHQGELHERADQGDDNQHHHLLAPSSATSLAEGGSW